MTAPVEGIANTLAALDAKQLTWTRNALRRLRDLGFDGEIAPASTSNGDWFVGEQLAFAPVGDAKPPSGAAAETLMAVLDRHENLLDQIERATGLAAEFADYGSLPVPLAMITLAQEQGCVAVRMPVSARHRPAALTILRPGFVVARLSVADAEQLAPGDMLILERGPWPILDSPAGLAAGTVGLDPATGRIAALLCGTDRDPTISTPLSEPIAMTQSTDTPGLKVSVALHLADIALTTDELSAMIERGAFDIGTVGEGLGATLSVGGRTIGRGEIVRLGDRFAVLLDGAEARTFAPLPETANDSAGAKAANHGNSADAEPEEQPAQPLDK